MVVDGQAIPLGSHIDSASPAEVTLAEKTLEQIRVHDRRRRRPKTWPQRLIETRAMIAILLGKGSRKEGSPSCHLTGRTAGIRRRKIAVCETDTEEDTPSNVPSPGLIASGA